MVKNLVFRGGGVKGVAYCGSLLELEDRGILKNLERTAGTSAGAIAACLVSLRFTAKEIFDITTACDFASFEDSTFVSDLETLNKYGFYKGQKFLEWIRSIISKKIDTYNDATFADFKHCKFIDLHVFATNLNTNSLTEFSFETTPNISVAEAIRCSMSIPLFFEASQLNGQMYVDGGLILNYAIETFDINTINESTLGLYIGVTTDKGIDSGLKFGEPKKYAVALIETLLKAQDEALYKSPDNMRRTIFINPCNISATNFKLTTDDKITLFKAGQEAVVKYFESH